MYEVTNVGRRTWMSSSTLVRSEIRKVIYMLAGFLILVGILAWQNITTVLDGMEIYFSIIHVFLFITLLFYGFKKIFFVDKRTFTYIYLFAIADFAVIAWSWRIFLVNDPEATYILMRNIVLSAKFFIVFNFIWLNAQFKSRLNLYKNLFETMLLVGIYGLIYLNYMQGISIHNSVVIQLSDIGISIYIFISLILRDKTKLLPLSVTGNGLHVLYVSLFCGFTLVDSVYSVLFTEHKFLIVYAFVFYAIMTLLLVNLVNSTRNYQGLTFIPMTNFAKRSYRSVKNFSTPLLDITLLVFIVDKLWFTRADIKIFIVCFVALIFRDIVIGTQRENDQYLDSENVFFTSQRSHMTLYKLGIDKTSRLFGSKRRGIVICDEDKEVVSFNQTVLNLFEMDGAEIGEDFLKKIKKIDANIFKEKFWETYESGKHQQINIRMKLENGNQRVLEVAMYPIAPDGIVIGIELVFTDLDVVYSTSTAQNSLAFLDHAVYEVKRNTFIQAVTDDVEGGSTGGVMVYASITDFDDLKDRLPSTIVSNIVRDFLTTIENLVPNESIIFHESEAAYLFYMKGERDELLRTCQEIHKENSWSKKLYKDIVVQRISLGIAFQDEITGDVEYWINETKLTKKLADKEHENHYIYEDSIKEKIKLRYFIRNSLIESMENKEFHMVYQPKVDSNSKRTLSFEALVRWIHFEKGFISPSDFIPIMEESNDIIKLGTYILNEVVRQQLEWLEQGIKIVPVSVNVSRNQFKDREFFDMLLQLHVDYPELEGKIALELTEREDITEDKELIRILNQLKEHGYDIQIDDFGAGKTVIASLVYLPISTVKIDRSIVSQVETEEYYRIIEAIQYMARGLNIDVVAEGVETKNEVSILKSLGCTQIQGYYFYQPLPVEEATDVLLNQPQIKANNTKNIFGAFSMDHDEDDI